MSEADLRISLRMPWTGQQAAKTRQTWIAGNPVVRAVFSSRREKYSIHPQKIA